MAEYSELVFVQLAAGATTIIAATSSPAQMDAAALTAGRALAGASTSPAQTDTAAVATQISRWALGEPRVPRGPRVVPPMRQARVTVKSLSDVRRALQGLSLRLRAIESAADTVADKYDEEVYPCLRQQQGGDLLLADGGRLRLGGTDLEEGALAFADRRAVLLADGRRLILGRGRSAEAEAERERERLRLGLGGVPQELMQDEDEQYLD